MPKKIPKETNVDCDVQCFRHYGKLLTNLNALYRIFGNILQHGEAGNASPHICRFPGVCSALLVQLAPELALYIAGAGRCSANAPHVLHACFRLQLTTNPVVVVVIVDDHEAQSTY